MRGVGRRRTIGYSHAPGARCPRFSARAGRCSSSCLIRWGRRVSSIASRFARKSVVERALAASEGAPATGSASGGAGWSWPSGPTVTGVDLPRCGWRALLSDAVHRVRGLAEAGRGPRHPAIELDGQARLRRRCAENRLSGDVACAPPIPRFQACSGHAEVRLTGRPPTLRQAFSRSGQTRPGHRSGDASVVPIAVLRAARRPNDTLVAAGSPATVIGRPPVQPDGVIRC